MVLAYYFTNWGIYSNKYFPSALPEGLTHVYYAFAAIKDGGVALLDEWADVQIPVDIAGTSQPVGCLGQLRELRRQRPGLRLVVSVGGWGKAAEFAAVASTEPARKRFAASVAAFVAHHGLDGVDLDWEYPQNSAEGASLTELVRELRQVLAPTSEISLAVPCSASHHFQLASLLPYVTYFNLMGYDLAGSWLETADTHSALYGANGVDVSVCRYLQRVPPQKLVLGMPAYGRSFGACQGRGGAYSGVAGFPEGIVPVKQLPIGREEYDPRTVSAWSLENGVFVGWDNTTAAETKGRYAREKQLAGGFWWEASMGGDALVQAFSRGMQAQD